MGKKIKKPKKDMAWLMGFETLAQQPVVVSLIVEMGNVDFVACITKKHYQDGGDDPKGTEEKPGKGNDNQFKKNLMRSYIG